MKRIQTLNEPKRTIDTHCEGAKQSIPTKYSARCHLTEPNCPHASENNYFPIEGKMYPVCRSGVDLPRVREYNK
jgi:hypothetical protein